MSTISDLLKQAQDSPEQAENIYKEILGVCALINKGASCTEVNAASTSGEHDQTPTLRDQEVALVKLGELYRDQK